MMRHCRAASNTTGDAFPSSIRVIEKAMANALKFVEHPKAKGADVRQSFDNSYVDEMTK